jgi:hypothetical protein
MDRRGSAVFGLNSHGSTARTSGRLHLAWKGPYSRQPGGVRFRAGRQPGSAWQTRSSLAPAVRRGFAQMRGADPPAEGSAPMQERPGEPRSGRGPRVRGCGNGGPFPELAPLLKWGRSTVRVRYPIVPCRCRSQPTSAAVGPFSATRPYQPRLADSASQDASQEVHTVCRRQ